MTPQVALPDDEPEDVTSVVEVPPYVVVLPDVPPCPVVLLDVPPCPVVLLDVPSCPVVLTLDAPPLLDPTTFDAPELLLVAPASDPWSADVDPPHAERAARAARARGAREFVMRPSP